MQRNHFEVMRRLVVMIKPLLGTMISAVLFGVLGHLCAIMIPVVGVYGLLGTQVKRLWIMLPLIAVMRGVLHYLEQNRNHDLAFRILAMIRDQVFRSLRDLCPAKLEGRDKGDLIAVLTADVELLEVFYAHTISPIGIAVIVSLAMTMFIGTLHPILGALALVSYCVVGIFVPIVTSMRSKGYGAGFRKEFGELDAFVLESLRGVNESIQFNAGKRRLAEIYTRSDALAGKEKKLKGVSGTNAAITSGIIFALDITMVYVAARLYLGTQIDMGTAMIAIVALMSSFGPVIALSNLGAGLQNTLAAGNRVLDILDEVPLVHEVEGATNIIFEDAACDDLSFAYEDEAILRDLSLSIRKGEITGISGRSGSGKSTLLKLLMRFWDVDSGSVNISGTDIRRINTKSLRDMESYVTQDTQLFHDSIEQNLLIANPDATREQVVDACKKASIHNFIMNLPNGYKTMVGELGETLSGGERQRLGIARAFLHDAPLILLDEPTSNLDSLNEATILKSLSDWRKDKTMVLVSHRKSTMCIADTVHSMENGSVS